MKKVILHLNGGTDPRLAGRMLGELSGVMVTDVQGDTLIVHCGQKMTSQSLLDALQSRGCSASEVSERPEFT